MKWVKAYKGFNEDMTCRGYQYPESGEVHVSDNANLCNEGAHACLAPIDVLGYYAPAGSIYREVELGGVSPERKGNNSKICGTDIRIGARLDIAGLVKAQIEYVKSNVTNENNAENGKAATAGYRGAATAGYRGAATAGDSGAATAGDSGAATAGDSGAATAGSYGAATSRGKTTVGKNGVALARGNNVMVRGGMGAILVAAEEMTNSYGIQSWCAAVVDGKTIKADTWYKIENGKFVEVENEE